MVYVDSGDGVARHRLYRTLFITLFDFEGSLDIPDSPSKNDFIAKRFAEVVDLFIFYTFSEWTIASMTIGKIICLSAFSYIKDSSSCFFCSTDRKCYRV